MEYIRLNAGVFRETEFCAWFLSLKSETDLLSPFLLVISLLVFIPESSSFHFLIMAEEANSFPGHFKKLTDPKYTNTFFWKRI